jgi:hypothetical protein
MVIPSFPFCENAFALDKPPVKVQPEILGIFLLDLNVVYMAGRGGGGTAWIS